MSQFVGALFRIHSWRLELDQFETVCVLGSFVNVFGNQLQSKDFRQTVDIGYEEFAVRGEWIQVFATFPFLPKWLNLLVNLN